MFSTPNGKVKLTHRPGGLKPKQEQLCRDAQERPFLGWIAFADQGVRIFPVGVYYFYARRARKRERQGIPWVVSAVVVIVGTPGHFWQTNPMIRQLSEQVVPQASP